MFLMHGRDTEPTSIDQWQPYTGDPVYWKTIPDLIKAHKLITETGLQNFLKCRILFQSGLNNDAWRSYLGNYWDLQLCDLLHYGFPLDFDRSCHLISSEVNHSSAINYSEHVQEYIYTRRVKISSNSRTFQRKNQCNYMCPH